MKFDTSFWMMFAFIVFMILGIWKIWDFLPTKQLEDDDKTEASEEELLAIVLQVIKEYEGNLSENELFQNIQKSESFDAKHYWRFNQNRLKQLLAKYYLQHKECSTILDIYKNSTQK
jgi:hypothetical protein